MKITIRHLSQFSLILFLAVIYLFFSTNIYAAPLTPAQTKVIKEGIKYTNTEDALTCAAGGTVTLTLPASTPAAYKTLFEQAAAKEEISPVYLAAIFVTEHGNTWPNPAGPWASSTEGASGPFQFMPGTWDEYGKDGNIQNLEDSTAAAARYLRALGATTSTPLGTLEKPYIRNPPTFMYIAGSYNAGPGTMQLRTTPNSGIEGSAGRDGKKLPDETVNYVKNVYYLLTTNFVHGNPEYGNKDGTVIDKTGGSTAPAITTSSSSSCTASSGDAGAIVQKAKELAWPDRGHGKEKADAKDTYQQAMPTVHTALVNDIWSDCGVYVSTVMRLSGADKDYQLRSTSLQLKYVENHPEKFILLDSVNDTSQLQPGDVLIYDGHTAIYLGTQGFQGYDGADASLGGHVPQAKTIYKGYVVVRLRG